MLLVLDLVLHSKGAIVYSLVFVILATFFVTACTDYEGMIDDDYEKWVKQQSFDPSVMPSTAVMGNFTDPRDGQVYRTAIIGSQEWMAQNLNYSTSNSSCYEGENAYCATYGRYYMWSAAQTACPNGWRLPSYSDWSEMFSAIGGISTAAPKIKASGGWSSGENGVNTYGFSALPAGYSSRNTDYYGMGHNAYFWSSTEKGSSFVYSVRIEYDYKYAEFNEELKYYALSIRCIKNSN